MNDAVAAPPVDDIWATKNPELKAGRGYVWSPEAKSLSGPHGLLRLATFALAAIQLLAIVSLGAMLYFFSLVSDGQTLDPALGEVLLPVIEIGSTILPIAAIAAGLAGLVTYLFFVYRGMKNLHLANSRQVTTSPGWAVGWSFIPFANLAMVPNVFKQIWVASHDPVSGKREAPATLILWWGCWIAGGIAGRIGEAVMPREDQLATMDGADYLAAFLPGCALAVLASILANVSCFFLLGLIKQVTVAQEALRSAAVFDE